MEQQQEETISSCENLNADLLELIFSYLPIPSLIRASSVCKLWHSLITNSVSSFSSKKPWFFLYGQNNIFLKKNQAFAFDPHSNQWLLLPPSLHQSVAVAGAGGFLFFLPSTTNSRFTFTPLLKSSWTQTLPLRFPRSNPLVGVFNDDDRSSGSGRDGSFRFIVVGGVRFIGGLVDIEDPLAVEIYDLNANSWELCPPLPTEFSSGNSSQWLCSAIFRGKFYVFGIFSCFVSAFDLRSRVWSEVREIRVPGMVFSFLISCSENLVLAGVCNGRFNLWKINVDDDDDERGMMELSEIGVMPEEFLNCLFDSEDQEDRFASLKCVGSGNLVYVFNEEHHKKYPACVCEIDERTLECDWRNIPDLPASVNQFHKVTTFCSNVWIGKCSLS